MPDPTKTISFRVSATIEDQIHEVAAAAGLSNGEWVRQLVMQALHALNPPNFPEPENLPASSSEQGASLAVEARIEAAEITLRQEINAVKTAITELTKSHHRDLCTAAEVGMNVEQSMEDRIEDTGVQILEAITELRQLQQIHKDDLLRAIDELAGIQR
jgi:hypothetical protein